MRVALSTFILIACVTHSHANQLLGITTVEVDNERAERSLSLSIWYPAEGGESVDVGGNAVFIGVSVAQNAPIISGKFPLVLVSHGGLRSSNNSGAWLTSALAQSGRIVVEINGVRPRSAKEAVNEIWQRPNDISRALDTILKTTAYSARVDMERIAVVGYALGGTAALAVAGGEFEAPTFIRSCAETRMKTPDCAWYKSQNVNLDSVDQPQLISAWRDPRIKLAVAINAEYLNAFSDSGASIAASSLLITLGSDDQNGSAIQAKGVTHSILTDANIFDGFGLCTPTGPTILSDEGGNPDLCGTSTEARIRAHIEIIDKIESQLNVEAGKTD